MKELNTRYGLLVGLRNVKHFQNGEVSSCELNMPNQINTSIGSMTPFYDSDGRRFNFNGLYFYEDGSLKSIDLQEQIEIKTSVGMIPAEKVIFYPTGNLKRVFPLNGDISGFWTEENESELMKPITIDINQETLSVKLIGLYLYHDGSLKSITLWPKEIIKYDTPMGLINCIIGLSFYPNGKLRSCEPAQPSLVDTPIGKIFAYDNNAIGVNGDINSLQFHENGRIKSLITDRNTVDIIHKGIIIKTIKPKLVRSYMDFEKQDIIPLKINFDENCVIFMNGEITQYALDKCQFIIKPFITGTNICTNCINCSSCG